VSGATRRRDRLTGSRCGYIDRRPPDRPAIAALGSKQRPARRVVVASRAGRPLHPPSSGRSAARTPPRPLLFAKFPPTWIAGTAALSVAKISEHGLGHSIITTSGIGYATEVHSHGVGVGHASAARAGRSRTTSGTTFTNVLGGPRLGYRHAHLMTSRGTGPPGPTVYNNCWRCSSSGGVAFDPESTWSGTTRSPRPGHTHARLFRARRARYVSGRI
jgi:hypothetical protein